MVSKKLIREKRDKEWRDAVMRRDKCCGICMKADGRLNAHHLIPKQFTEFRWDMDNGMILCFQHHKGGKNSVHQNAVWFAEWLRKNRPKQYAYIVSKIERFK